MGSGERRGGRQKVSYPSRTTFVDGQSKVGDRFWRTAAQAPYIKVEKSRIVSGSLGCICRTLREGP